MVLNKKPVEMWGVPEMRDPILYHRLVISILGDQWFRLNWCKAKGLWNLSTPSIRQSEKGEQNIRDMGFQPHIKTYSSKKSNAVLVGV